MIVGIDHFAVFQTIGFRAVRDREAIDLLAQLRETILEPLSVKTSRFFLCFYKVFIVFH